MPSSPGVPGGSHRRHRDRRPGTTAEAVLEASERFQLAAIIAEPIPANMGVVPAAEGFLELLRERANATGALLVLDEVISGFRVARGGAQELTGVAGDLVIMGKVIGGGLPAGAVGGARVADGAAGARRRGLPGGHALGQPARDGGGARDTRAARRGRLRAPRERPPIGSPWACARRLASGRCGLRAGRDC